MQPWAHDSYLTTEVLTACPQRLRLLLIDGAIRFAQRAQQFWQAGENAQASQSLIRAQEIVNHILSELGSTKEPGLARKVSAVYLFIFRALMEANCRHDEKKLGDALRVLDVERETWRQVCEQLANPQEAEPLSGPVMPPNFSSELEAGYRGGFSIEA